MKDGDLEEGTFIAADVKGVHLLVARIGGEVSAVSGTCTHEETDLSIGFMLEERIVCPLHLSQFSLKTGEVQNPPAVEPLKVFNVKIQDGTIFVEV